MTLSNIINRFMYRDLVYIFSGSIIILYLGYGYYFNIDYNRYLHKLLNLKIEVYLLFFLSGLSYILSLASKVIFKAIFPTRHSNEKKAKQEYANKLEKIKNEEILNLLERCVFFKEIGATLGSSLIVVLLILVIKLFLILNAQPISISLIVENIISILLIITLIFICKYLNYDNSRYERDLLNIR